MLDQRYRWKNRQIREQVAVINGKKSPTKLLTNARFLHSALKQMDNSKYMDYNDELYTLEKSSRKRPVNVNR